MYPGSYPVDFLQQMSNYLLGFTTYPLWYGSANLSMTSLSIFKIPQDSESEGFMSFVSFIADLINSNGLVQGVVWNRIKGFFKKAASFVAHKVWPVIKPLVGVASSVLPGPANLVLSRVSSGIDSVIASVNSIAVSNGSPATVDASGAIVGDKF